jgi:hypothetical protein
VIFDLELSYEPEAGALECGFVHMPRRWERARVDDWARAYERRKKRDETREIGANCALFDAKEP